MELKNPIEIKKICGNCRFWDWYYCDGNVEDEDGVIIAEYGYCTLKLGWNGGWFGKNEPACEKFETMLCEICGEYLKLRQLSINGETHIEWTCKGHMRKCDTCGLQEVFA